MECYKDKLSLRFRVVQCKLRELFNDMPKGAKIYGILERVHGNLAAGKAEQD